MRDAIRPVQIYFHEDGNGPPAFDVEIAEDDNRFSYDGWLPLALEEVPGSFRVTGLGDNWLTAPGGSGGQPLDAGPVESEVTVADCAAELKARLASGIHHYSGEWEAENYSPAHDRPYVAAQIANRLKPLLTQLEEEQTVIDGLTMHGLDHLDIGVGTLQFMEGDDQRLHAEPPGDQDTYTRAVEEFVKTNHPALIEHLERRAAETREHIRRVMHAAARMRAFGPMDAPAE